MASQPSLDSCHSACTLTQRDHGANRGSCQTHKGANSRAPLGGCTMSRSNTGSFFSKLFSSPDRSSAKLSTKRETPSLPTPFRSVSILQGPNACCASKDLAKVRFLSKQAPALPLAKCDMQHQCQCRYVKHADRRTESRRLIDAIGMSALLFESQERRAKVGRRKTD
jgi:hypothetical protein